MAPKTFTEKVKWWYLTYELHTALYMLETWEKRVFNTMLLAVIGMASYTTWVFLPRYAHSVAAYFGW